MSDPVIVPETAASARELEEARANVLRLPAEKALAAILDHPRAAALVRSFPETDLYLLVQDIGPEDALPLLALASEKQWEHIVDLEVWNRDRLDGGRTTRWLSLLMEADPRRFLAWLLAERLNFAELYLFHNIEVRLREHDQDPSEFGEEFFTLDQVYYVRVLNPPPGPGGAALEDEERRLFLTRLLERLADTDHRIYQNVLLEASHVIPAEAEEEEYRLRGVRLAEKGFEPFDEAVGIYQPITPAQLAAQAPKSVPPPPPEEEQERLPVPAYPFKEAPPDAHFNRALARIEPGEVLGRIQWEFANLCNRLIVADGKAVRDREHLRAVVAKACGYVGIGLERLAEGRGPAALDPARTAAQLARYPLAGLFRLGFGAALRVKWEAERWLAGAWFAQAGLRLSFWGEQWMGFLGGILLKRPLFYDNYQSGLLYREFRSLAEVALAEQALRQVQAVDGLLAAIRPRLGAPGRHRFLTWKSLLLTRWAARRLDLRQEALAPVPRSAFTRFFRELFPGDAPADPAVPRRISEALKAEFVRWLGAESGWPEVDLSERLGAVFEELFAEVEAECGRVAAENLDPRFVQLFLLKAD
jgi:hypothetical protein